MELHSPGGENESMERLHGVCAPARRGERECVRVRARVCWSARVVQFLSGSGRSNAGENESFYMSLRVEGYALI